MASEAAFIGGLGGLCIGTVNAMSTGQPWTYIGAAPIPGLAWFSVGALTAMVLRHVLDAVRTWFDNRTLRHVPEDHRLRGPALSGRSHR